MMTKNHATNFTKQVSLLVGKAYMMTKIKYQQIKEFFGSCCGVVVTVYLIISLTLWT